MKDLKTFNEVKRAYDKDLDRGDYRGDLASYCQQRYRYIYDNKSLDFLGFRAKPRDEGNHYGYKGVF